MKFLTKLHIFIYFLFKLKLAVTGYIRESLYEQQEILQTEVTQ